MKNQKDHRSPDHSSEFERPFHIEAPQKITQPFVFNSPHSGRIYPENFVNSSRLDALTLRKSEDAYVEELFADVPKLGAPLLYAHFPRAYLDVNREPYELDPELFTGALPEYANTKSIRVIGGLGTIARVVTESEEIYNRPISIDDALKRIKQLYMPYHTKLQNLLNECQARFGFSILIDCHSMPSIPGSFNHERPDFVLGDRFGKSCDKRLTNLIHEALTEMGYVVAMNKPYAGGYITENYGKPHKNSHALQIEINRSLYMNENTFEKNDDFQTIRNILNVLVQRVFDDYEYSFSPVTAAAE
ncbi:MAG: N-formylglutamate amidohydrolase [Pseudomonadota bacterium]